MADAIDITLGAKDLTKGAFDSVESAIKHLSGSIGVVTSIAGGMVNALAKLGFAASGIEAIGKSAAGMAQALLGGNAALEMTTISFKTLLGSASAADAMIKQLTTFAQNTPFELTGLEANTQKLLAFGFGAKDIIPLMTSLGDAISALGGTQDNLNSLVYVMGQMRQEAHINAGDIMQMVNQGIPALQMLADHYHKTTGEIQEMISKGLIPGNEAVGVFTTGLEQKYGGMMAAQSATFSGMLSNLQDWASATMLILSKPFFEPAKKALAGFLSYVQSPAGVIAINKLAGYVQAGVDRMTKLFNALLPKFEPLFAHILRSAEAIQGRLTPAVVALTPQLEKLWHTVEPIAAAVLKVVSAFSPLGFAFVAIKGYLEGGVNGALQALGDRFANLEKTVTNALTLVVNAFQKYGPKFVDWVIPIGELLITKLAGVLGQVFNWVTVQAPIILGKLKEWATSFVDWVLPIAGQLLQKLGAVLTTVLNWVKDHADEILNQLAAWAESLIGWILPMIPKIIEALSGVLNKIILWVATKAPAVLTALLKWALQFVNWIKPMIGQVMLSLRDLIDVLLRWISQNAPTIINELLGWALAFIKWIDPLIPVLINALARVISSVLNWITGHAGEVLNTVLGWVNQFVLAFGTLIPQLLQALGVVIQALLKWIFDHGPDILVMLVGWAEQFIDWAFALFDALKPSLEVFINRVLQWLVARGPELLDKLWGWIRLSINIVEQLFSFIAPVLIQLVTRLGSWIRDNAKNILDNLWGFLKLGLNLATELLTYITPVLVGIITGIGQWVRDHAKEILDNLWGFLKAGLNLASELFTNIAPVLEGIIINLGQWIAAHAQEILDKLWSFLDNGLNLVTSLFQKIEPVLVQIFAQISTWLINHGQEILDSLWSFVKIAVNTGVLFYTNIRPMLEELTKQMGQYLYNEATTILGELAKGVGDWVATAKGDDWINLGKALGNFILQGIKLSPFGIFIQGVLSGLGDIGMGSNMANVVNLMNNPQTPKKALGDSSFKGGPVLWGEAGLERFSLPGGADFYSAGPVYTPNAPAGSSFTPMSGSAGGGGAQVVHQHYYTIYGNPDRATMMQMEKMTERVVEKKLADVKSSAQNLRTVNRTRG